MTKEAFIARHVNELTGFLLEAFIVRVAEDEAKVKCPGFSAARKGEFMIEQMGRARATLAKLFDEMGPRTLEQVKEDAKALSDADRAKFREWIDSQPKKKEAAK